MISYLYIVYKGEDFMEKQEISARTTVKAIITGFVSYGIILIFIELYHLVHLIKHIFTSIESRQSPISLLYTSVIRIKKYF